MVWYYEKIVGPRLMTVMALRNDECVSFSCYTISWKREVRGLDWDKRAFDRVEQESPNSGIIDQEEKEFRTCTKLPFLLIDDLGVVWFLLNMAELQSTGEPLKYWSLNYLTMPVRISRPVNFVYYFYIVGCRGKGKRCFVINYVSWMRIVQTWRKCHVQCKVVSQSKTNEKLRQTILLVTGKEGCTRNDHLMLVGYRDHIMMGNFIFELCIFSNHCT
jgi:hypothetical protein